MGVVMSTCIQSHMYFKLITSCIAPKLHLPCNRPRFSMASIAHIQFDTSLFQTPQPLVHIAQTTSTPDTAFSTSTFKFILRQRPRPGLQHLLPIILSHHLEPHVARPKKVMHRIAIATHVPHSSPERRMLSVLVERLHFKGEIGLA